MTDPIVTVGKDTKAALWNGSQCCGTLVLGVFLLAVLGGIGAFIGESVGEVGLLAAFPIAILFWIANSQQSYKFYEDRVVVDGPLGGRLVTGEAAYDEVAFAVRRSPTNFELVREDAKNLQLKHVADPDRVERTLVDFLPSPDEWLDQRDPQDTALRALMRRRQTWEHDDEDVPVFDAELFEELTGTDPESGVLDSLDDVTDVSDVSDIDADDLDAGGDDGGDFGGGGAGGDF